MNFAAVQQLFNELFPFLKIEFFEKESKAISGSFKKRVHNTTKRLADFIITKDAVQEISIHPEMTVTELEKEFAKVYKLHTQVFRKSGNIWLETTITDGWTLEEQNSQGEMITAQMIKR